MTQNTNDNKMLAVNIVVLTKKVGLTHNARIFSFRGIYFNILAF